ncbi:MAG: beta-lactamase family protein [Clostridia bacterium]|nr:beta-lactamase family protein [Clostridia bacterium]
MIKYDLDSFDKFMDELFEKSKYPGLSYTVRGPEGIIYQKSFGKRSIEENLDVDNETMFGLASMSKSFVCFALSILAAEGKFSFDDPVTKYLPNFKVPGIPKDCVTVRHLAMHTSGIPPIQPLEWSIAMNSVNRPSQWYTAMVNTSPNKMDKIEQIIDYIAAGDYGQEGYTTLGSPGEYMSYSNEGYAILCYVFDEAAGVKLEDFLMERVFKPLGMNHTVLDEDSSEARKISGGNLTHLFEMEDGKLIEDDDWSVLPPFRSCACIKSTSNDVSRYYSMIANKGKLEGKQVFPEEVIDLMVGSRFALEQWPLYCYGLSKRFYVDAEGKRRTITDHSGALHGVSTSGGAIDGGYSAVALCNQGEIDADPFMWAGYNLIMGYPYDKDLHWAKPNGTEFSEPEALVGKYIVEEGEPQIVEVTLENGKLKVVYAGEDVILKHCGQGKFVVYSAKEPEKRLTTVEFLIRDGKAWAARCGTRFHWRIKN